MKVTVKGKEYELEDLHITGVSSDEKEATINVCAPDEVMHVYTSDDSYLTKIKKCVTANPDEWKITRVVERRDGTVSGVMAEAPKNFLTLRTMTKTITMSEEQKAASAIRLKEGRSKKS